MIPTPLETGDAALVVDDALARLTEAAANRRHAMHTPVVASGGPDGPDQRVMVLRGVEGAMLRFHTDARSPKCQAFQRRPAVSVLAYDTIAKVQLRLRGTASVQRDGRLVDAAWTAATAFARRCYLVQPNPGAALDTPGSGLPHGLDGAMPTAEQLVEGRQNFAVVLVDVTLIDWLYLAATGHRRAIARRSGDGPASPWTAEWVVP